MAIDAADFPPVRVLLVEDDPHVQQLGRLILSGADYEVACAGTVREAHDLLAARIPDVVLLDVHLPDGLGLEVLETMQKNPETAGVPVIVVTGSMEAGAVRALDAGAHDFLPKPFEPEELLARVRAALRVKHAHDELTRQARIDPLTSLPNRRALDETLGHAIGHCVRRRESLAVALMDVIDFKGVNDVHGHAVGDEVLCGIGRTLLATRRSGDVIGRWGGDEFLAILPGADAEEAKSAVARLQHAVTDGVRLQGRTIELRVGISACQCDSDTDGEELVRLAATNLRDVHATG